MFNVKYYPATIRFRQEDLMFRANAKVRLNSALREEKARLCKLIRHSPNDVLSEKGKRPDLTH